MLFQMNHKWKVRVMISTWRMKHFNIAFIFSKQPPDASPDPRGDHPSRIRSATHIARQSSLVASDRDAARRYWVIEQRPQRWSIPSQAVSPALQLRYLFSGWGQDKALRYRNGRWVIEWLTVFCLNWNESDDATPVGCRPQRLSILSLEFPRSLPSAMHNRFGAFRQSVRAHRVLSKTPSLQAFQVEVHRQFG